MKLYSSKGKHQQKNITAQYGDKTKIALKMIYKIEMQANKHLVRQLNCQMYRAAFDQMQLKSAEIRGKLER